MKHFLPLLLIIFTSSLVYGQKFVFSGDFSLLYTQIDGDRLTGYHKRGFRGGVGVNYPLGKIVSLNAKTSFYRHGSSRKNSFQERVPDGSQLVMNINSVGLEWSLEVQPINSNTYFSTGFVVHRVFSFDVEPVNFIVNGPKPAFSDDNIETNFVDFTFLLGYKLSPNNKVFVSFNRTLSNLLIEPFDGVNKLAPYNIGLGYIFTINPRPDAKPKRVRKRRK